MHVEYRLESITCAHEKSFRINNLYASSDRKNRLESIAYEIQHRQHRCNSIMGVSWSTACGSYIDTTRGGFKSHILRPTGSSLNERHVQYMVQYVNTNIGDSGLI